MFHWVFRVAVLTGIALGWSLSAWGKPPDLPAEVKPEVTPIVEEPTYVLDPPGPDKGLYRLESEESLRKRMEKEDEERANQPAFYKLRLAARQQMTTCILLGVHPLLTLVQPNAVLYVPEDIREAIEEANKQKTVTLKFGVGVNSDAGVVGTIVLNERNFDITWPPTCPAAKQSKPATPAVKVEVRSVLDNLRALEDADKLFQDAQELLRTGRACEACDLLERITRTVPGSRFSEMASAAIARMIPKLSGDVEEAEENSTPTPEDLKKFFRILCPWGMWQQSEIPTIGELFKKSEEYRQIEGEWQRFWFEGKPVERIHGGIQEEDDEDEPMSLENFTVYGTPVTLVVSDLLSGQGLHFYPEKPLAPVEVTGEEEQEPKPKFVLATYQAADLVAGECGEKTLLDLIRRTVAPRTWQQAGGVATIDYFPLTGTLHVNQTADIQGQVRDLLTSLRRLNAPERGVKEQVEGLVKAAKQALECDRHEKAVELVRQIQALDAERVRCDAMLRSLAVRVNNCEPSCRPPLPRVDAGIRPALELVLAQAEVKPVKFEVVIEETCEADRLVQRAYALRDMYKAACAWKCVCDYVPSECCQMVKFVCNYRFAAVQHSSAKVSFTISYGWFGWQLETQTTDDNR